MPDIGSVIDFYLHPPIGRLQPHLDTSGPYPSGSHTITRFSGSVLTAETYGVLVRAASPIPVEWGYYNGYVSDDGQIDGFQYQLRVAQLVVQHQFSGGAWTVSQQLDVFNFYQALLWSESLPGRLGLWVEPGISLDLYYLTTS